MDNITMEGTELKKVIRLSGEITIENASKMKDAFLEAMEAGSASIELDVRSVESADLAFIQVLCSAHRSCVKAGITLAITGDVPEGLKSSLEDMGFNQWVCDAPFSTECLWTREVCHV